MKVGRPTGSYAVISVREDSDSEQDGGDKGEGGAWLCFEGRTKRI